MIEGLLGLLILIADIWAIVNILGSSAGVGAKIVWTIVVLALPVLGLLVWYLAGPKSAAVA